MMFGVSDAFWKSGGMGFNRVSADSHVTPWRMNITKNASSSRSFSSFDNISLYWDANRAYNQHLKLTALAIERIGFQWPCRSFRSCSPRKLFFKFKMAAHIVYDGAVGSGNLFTGTKFYILQKVPTRNTWKDLIIVRKLSFLNMLS